MTLIVHLVADAGPEVGFEQVCLVLVTDPYSVVDYFDLERHLVRVWDRLRVYDDYHLLVVHTELNRVLNQVYQNLSGSEHVDFEVHVWSLGTQL